jgi:hypothetical protein
LQPITKVNYEHSKVGLALYCQRISFFSPFDHQ